MCGYSRCRNCNETDKTNEHKCYILPKDPKAYTEKYIFFDYEAEQDSGIHRPNLILAHYFDGTKFISKPTKSFANG